MGTLQSKVNLKADPDIIYRFDKKNNFTYKTENIETSFISDSFYYEKYLEKKDKYSYFFGGNPAHVKITSSNKNNKTLIIIKDSYAHCFVPFIADKYETVHMIDLRYINTNAEKYINSLNPTDILIMYNIKTISEDSNINKLK